MYIFNYPILYFHLALLNMRQKKLTYEMVSKFSKTEIISNVWYKE